MSERWTWYVIIITLVNILGCAWLLFWARTKRAEPAKGTTLGHDFDGIQELDTPLPRWWLWLFVGSIVFAVGYLALFGLGTFRGLLGWTSKQQFDQEMAHAQERYGPIYARYAAQPIPALLADDQALKIGQRLFANNCAQCHGSDARGGVGFPNLTDGDWLYGGDPDTVEKSIHDGRAGVMPAFAAAIGGDEGVAAVAAYVLSLGGRAADPAKVSAGKEKFQTICVACHGADAKGNPALGAPNLTDDVWLYGGGPGDIAETLQRGRAGKMPAHGELLGAEKVHLLASYVYSLSHGK